MSKPPILMRREGSRLVPLDAWSAEQLDAYPDGRDLAVRVTKATARGEDESEGILRLWWAGVNLLHENIDGQGMFPTPRHLSKHILKEIGAFISVPDGHGGTKKIAESISLANLEDPEDRRLLLEVARAYVVKWKSWDPWTEWKDQKELEKRQSGGRR